MPQAVPRVVPVALVALVTQLGACGKHAGSEPEKAALDAAKPVATPLAMPQLGVDHVARFGYDDGPALANATAKAKAKDWHAAIELAQAIIAKNPSSFETQRLLAGALAQTGEPAAAVDHLVAALAADYYHFAPTLADADLESFRATPHGRAIADLAQQIHDEYTRRVAQGLWLVARRKPFRWPDKPGVQFDNSRGELYAYDRASRRFLRLTYTDHQVVGFVRAPSGNQVALLGFDRVEHGKTDDEPPVFARAWIEVVDAVDWKPVGPRATLPSAREIAIGFGSGDAVIIAAAQATGRWTTGDAALSSFDPATGKLTKAEGPLPVPRIVVTLDEGRVVRPPAVEAEWAGDPPTAATLKAPSGASIAVPESGQASQATIAVSPDRARVAFATAADPCAKDVAPSLYVADGKTASHRHVLTARSRFDTRWVDATTLAYEDGDGAIRLWDATTGRQAERLVESGGIALDVLSLRNGPVCKQTPTGVPGEPSGSGSGSGSGSDELPPEEPTQ